MGDHIAKDNFDFFFQCSKHSESANEQRPQPFTQDVLSPGIFQLNANTGSKLTQGSKYSVSVRLI